MSEIDKLAQQMRADWDRRVKHDYRFWMSDAYSDDRTMWESGARDFEILMRDISRAPQATLLDLGCGVGRLIPAALSRFSQVIGIDVSAAAIQKATELLGKRSGLTLKVGNGVDLGGISDSSIDVLTSFAALSSVPSAIVARYFAEFHRVLKPDGVARLQLYLGSEQFTQRGDTLHLRCYQKQQLEEALRLAGLSLESTYELVLPIQVSFKEMGIEAVIISVRRTDAVPADPERVAAALMPNGEAEINETTGNDLEYWMTLNYARELADRGDFEKARSTLEYAERVAHTAALDVSDILQRIISTIEKGEASCQHADKAGAGRELNMDALVQSKFPAAWSMLQAFNGSPAEVRQTEEGPVVFQEGQCLDHPAKPRAAAEQWARRVMEEEKYKDCSELVVVGLGAGYHIEALRQLGCHKKIHLIEPDPAVAKAALSCRSGSWLERIESLQIGPQAELPAGEVNYELWIRPQTQALNPEVSTKLRSAFYGKRGLALLKPTIGVVGPLSGGGLPMVAYVSRALFGIEQRFREYDVTGFSGGYTHLEKFVVDKMRRGHIETTYCEMVSQVLLESINEKPIDILICMALSPITPRVLLELRKRGIITVLWFVEDYTRFTYWKEIAKFYDFVFTIQKGKCIEAIKAAGAGEVHYLPVGCDPGIHAPLELNAEDKARWGSPISFMGAGYHNRQQLMASLAEYPLKIWGTEWPGCRPFDRLVQEGGRRLKPVEYVKVFNATDINLNLHSSHERDGVDPFGDFINPRTFELASTGVFQLIDERSLLPEMFEIGKEMVTFRSGAELREKIDYYLKHPEERAQVAKAARARALKDHTYSARMRSMLSMIYSSRFEQIKTRLDTSPWRKMLARSKPHPELHARCETAFQRGEEPALDALVSDIVAGHGRLSETEQKLMFLYHVRKQIIRMKIEEGGGKN